MGFEIPVPANVIARSPDTVRTTKQSDIAWFSQIATLPTVARNDIFLYFVYEKPDVIMKKVLELEREIAGDIEEIKNML